MGAEPELTTGHPPYLHVLPIHQFERMENRFFASLLTLPMAFTLAFLGLLSSTATACQEDRSPDKLGKVEFVRDIQPILRDHCYDCHAGENEEGGLNLAIKSRALEGGDSDSPLVAGDSKKSLMFQLVTGVDKDRMMPPEGNKPLSAKQIETLKNWIDQGAKWPAGTDVIDPKMDRAQRHWAFQRLQNVKVPNQKETHHWIQTSIDSFVWHRLASSGLRPAKPADARTLVRRLYFDLIGLPPSAQQISHFIRAHRENPKSAIQQLVDKLLESPQYGERWGRHWLDVARYADSDGQESDMDRPHAYTYRDFVIQSLNDDMPYDQFVRWQIAGDEYEPENDAAISATGFLTAGPAFKLPDSFLESERLMNRYNELDDVIGTLGSGLLGMTVACARCHDHKYDAFSAKEYYQLLGVFHSGDRTTAELPSGKKAFIFRDFDTERRTTWLFRRSDFYDREIEVDLGFPQLLSAGPTAKDYWERAKKDYQKLGKPRSTLQRRALADWITNTEQGGGALLARVMVNRIWHHHFGKGLVGTTSDFGVRGDPPTHPQLLEYLAHQFANNGWNIKSLHRLILTSSVWQQSSTRDSWDPRGPQIDPANQLLWRMRPLRLEAEALRDSMLFVSQTLNLQAGGPGFKPYIAPEANLARNIKGEGYPKNARDDASTRRRSIYMFHKRLIPYPMFQAFDRPDLMTSCARRQNTTVAPQAMVILNDRFVRAVARDFAKKILAGLNRSGAPIEGAKLDKGQAEVMIGQAFEAAFARLPTSKEVNFARQFIQSQTAARQKRNEKDPQLESVTDFCQSLFGLNEFIYVD